MYNTILTSLSEDKSSSVSSFSSLKEDVDIMDSKLTPSNSNNSKIHSSALLGLANSGELVVERLVFVSFLLHWTNAISIRILRRIFFVTAVPFFPPICFPNALALVSMSIRRDPIGAHSFRENESVFF